MSDNFNNTFPHPALTKLGNERPTQMTLRQLHKELNANAISVSSFRGNGTLGHFALVATPEAYLTASGNIPFEPPVQPGPAPVHPIPATAAQITEINRQYLADVKEFTTYANTESSLKKLLLAAVPDTFTSELSDDLLGYASVTVLALLQHLDTNYGTITADDLDLNLKNLYQEWTTNQPLEDLFNQIIKCRAFASTIDPITEQTAVRAALQNLENTGVFTDAIRDWRKIPLAERTMGNLKTFFTLADNERKRALTTRSAGYHQAATVSIAPTTVPDNNNIALAAAPTPMVKIETKIFYCWSHGLGPNKEHTSATCNAKQRGHRDTATIYNMLGGCNYIRRRRGEVAVYVRPRPNAVPTATLTAEQAIPTANTATSQA
jgi:hypothetical protein